MGQAFERRTLDVLGFPSSWAGAGRPCPAGEAIAIPLFVFEPDAVQPERAWRHPRE